MTKSFKVTLKPAASKDMVRITITGRGKAALLRAAYLADKTASFCVPSCDGGVIIDLLREGAEYLRSDEKVVLEVVADYSVSFEKWTK